MRLLVGLLAVVTTGAACRAQDAPAVADAPGLVLRDGVVVEPVTGDVAAGYVTVTNRTPLPDTLLEVLTPIAASAEVHAQVEAGGMVHMEHQHHLVIPAGGEVVLAPGGLHLMLQELNATIAAGDTVAVTFRFARAGDLRAEFPVVRYRDLP